MRSLLINYVASIKKIKFWIIITTLFSIFMGITPSIVLWLNKEVLNNISILMIAEADHDIKLFSIIIILAIILIINIINSLIKIIDDYYYQKTVLSLDVELKEDLQNKLSRVNLIQFEDSHFYNNVLRVSSDMGSNYVSPIKKIVSMIQSSLSIISFVILLFAIHWSLVVLSLCFALPALTLLTKLERKNYENFVEMAPLTREVGFLSRLFSERDNSKEIRVFKLNQFIKDKWKTNITTLVRNNLWLIKRESKVNLTLEFTSGIIFIIISISSIFILLNQQKQVGDYISVSMAIAGIQASIAQVVRLYSELFSSFLYIRDYQDFMKSEPATEETKKEKFKFSKEIIVDNLSFRYPLNNYNSLSDVSFTINKGEKIAIVGDNGSGKTTLLKILLGLYDSNGAIKVDEVPIDNISQSSLFDHITAVFQDFVKYPFTFEENILLGKPKDEKVFDQVLQYTNLIEATEKLSDGVNTRLGKIYGGEDLSIGQWQKVAIARAIIRNSDIMVFDEPTSALDPTTELKLFENVLELSSSRTSIIISHRLGITRYVDKIIVMKEGRVIEQGKFEKLISTNSYFRSMYEAQSKWYV